METGVGSLEEREQRRLCLSVAGRMDEAEKLPHPGFAFEERGEAGVARPEHVDEAAATEESGDGAVGGGEDGVDFGDGIGVGAEKFPARHLRLRGRLAGIGAFGCGRVAKVGDWVEMD